MRLIIPLILILNILITGSVNKPEISAGAGYFIITYKELNYKSSVKRFGNLTIRDYTEYTDESSAGNYKLPKASLIIALPREIKPEFELKIASTRVYESEIPALNPSMTQNNDSAFTLEEVFDYAAAQRNYTEKLITVKKYFWLRNYYCAEVEVSPVIFNAADNKLTEITAYSIIIRHPSLQNIQLSSPVKIESDFDNVLSSVISNHSIAGQFRSLPPLPENDTTGNWINYSADYVKVGIAKDAVYRITRQDFEQLTISIASIDPRTFRLYYRGTETGIFVKGEEDGSFDPNDYIEFSARMNYTGGDERRANSSQEPYANFMDLYTDTTYFFLTWGNGTGKRIRIQSQQASGLTDTLNYYTFFAHIEQNNMYQPLSLSTVTNQDPDWTSTNAWVWQWYGTNTLNYTINITDPIPNRNAAFYFKAISGASSIPSNSHNIALRVNQNLVDTAVFNRNEVIFIGKTYNSSILTSGNNTLTIQNHSNGTSSNLLAMDWYEYEYPRLLRAYGDSLIFEIRDSISRAHRIIRIEGVSQSQLSLYKWGINPKKIENYLLTGSSMIFSDTVGSGDIYMLMPDSKILKPQFLQKKNFINLRSNLRSAEYITLTNKVFKTEAEEYSDFIKNSYQLNTTTIFVNDIFDEFNFGYPDPAAIRLFLRTSYSNWQAPKPSYLFIIGSASYDYKRYVFKSRGYELNQNWVISYGEPVSDVYYTMFDSNQPLIPQMYCGRLPAKEKSHITNYLGKHSNYLSQRYDQWNKKAIFFSGGDANDPSQLVQYKSINDAIISQYATVPPYSLNHDHFYKTANPQSDFGPYDPIYIKNSIDEGGVFISYIGHSGTRTWDNSIADPNQLLNKVNKSPLVTDFGCSTVKFAEPDVEAFGALFVNTGQTIGYIGNTSLGFTSTSTILPGYFYGNILSDSILQIGVASTQSKLKMFGTLGSTGTYRIFAYTNTLMGDPIIKLALPSMPNLKLSNSDYEILNSNPNDSDDSLTIKIRYFNIGSFREDSISISVISKVGSILTNQQVVKVRLPEFSGEATFSLPIKNRPGRHSVTFILDESNIINEIYEDDNKIEFTFNVASLSLRDYGRNLLASYSSPNVKLINNTLIASGNPGEIIAEIDTLTSFNSANSIIKPIDTFFTKITFNGLQNGKRYYVRTRYNQTDTLWGFTNSVMSSLRDFRFYLNDSYSLLNQELTGTKLDDPGILLLTDSLQISVMSGSGNYSKFGSVTRNGINVLPNTFSWGFGIAVFDLSDFSLDTAMSYWSGASIDEAVALTNLINSVDTGKLVAMCVIDDGASNLNANLKSAIKTLGSTKVDSIKFRTPWTLIGIKGGAPGSAKEEVRSSTYQGILTIDTMFLRDRARGTLLTQELTDAASWGSVHLVKTQPEGSQIKVRPVGIKADGSADTLGYLSFSSDSASITGLSVKTYPSFRFLIELEKGSSPTSPVLHSFGVNYDLKPEIGVNYQTVSETKDTVFSGETITLNFKVYNAGDYKADSFKVLVDIVNPDNSRNRIFDTLVTTLGAEQNRAFSLDYTPLVGASQRKFSIQIDPDNRVDEFYKDNNTYEIPFVIKPDTSDAFIVLKNQGGEFFDDEFLPSRPNIRIELHDPSLLPVNDTSNIRIELNGERVYYNPGELSYSFSNNNPKMVAEYTPSLSAGEYELNVKAKNALGVLLDSTGITKRFIVSDEAKLMSVYPYPNPSNGPTNFTFILPAVPEELKIKIFTISGRLIKEISRSGAELKHNFNYIPWDGRDEDGDEVANGVYLYKIYIRKDGKLYSETHKLAIVR
ncbi:MAG: hypothetical protein HUU54_14360 [Ignavibacteriaceae bacterium]|nr:hypothetical protein [Ignavibacteriaceae bacterium]